MVLIAIGDGEVPWRNVMLVNRKTAHAVCPSCGFTVETRHHAPAHCETHRRVAELRGSGMSDAEVARELGISRERVRQILLKIGPDKAIETIARTVVANAHKLGKELSLPRVIELVKSAIQD